MKTLIGALVALLWTGAALADPAGAGLNPGTAGTQSGMIGCVYRSGAIAPVDGQQMGVGCNSTGQLIVTGSGGGGTIDTNLAQVAGATVQTGHGTAAGAIRVELPTDGTGVVSIGSSVLPSGAATSALQTTGNASLSTLAGTVSAGNINVVCTSGCSGGGGGGGTSSNFGSAFPTAGTAVGFLDSAGANMVAGNLDASGNLKTSLGAAIPAGTNVIGHVITDATSTTAVTQATAANLNATVVGTGTFAVQNTAAIPAGANTIGAVTQASGPWTVNLTQVNGNGMSTGAGAVGVSTQRISVGQDTTTVAGSAPGTAGTASANVVSIQGITSMTPVQVSQATAGNLNAQIVGTGSNGSAVSGNAILIGGSDGTNKQIVATTTTGAVSPPTAASGKITEGIVTLTTATSTTIVASNANRIALEIQCDGGPVKVSRNGATLTSSAIATGNAGVILPVSNALYTFPIVSTTAVTGYQSTGGNVVCSYADYSK